MTQNTNRTDLPGYPFQGNKVRTWAPTHQQRSTRILMAHNRENSTWQEVNITFSIGSYPGGWWQFPSSNETLPKRFWTKKFLSLLDML